MRGESSNDTEQVEFDCGCQKMQQDNNIPKLTPVLHALPTALSRPCMDALG